MNSKRRIKKIDNFTKRIEKVEKELLEMIAAQEEEIEQLWEYQKHGERYKELNNSLRALESVKEDLGSLLDSLEDARQ